MDSGSLAGAPRLVADGGMRIGDAHDPDAGFTVVRGAAVDRDGDIIVLEESVPEFRVYDAEGTLLRRFGRRGGGPGEFERIAAFGLLGDTLWAVDIGLNRITLFDRAGTLLSTGNIERNPISLASSFGHLYPWMLRPDGRFASRLAMVSYNPGGEAIAVSPSDSFPVPLVLFSPSGAIVDTAGWAPHPPPRMWRPPSQEEEEGFRFVEVAGQRFLAPSPPTTLATWLTFADGYGMVETPLAPHTDEGIVIISRFGEAGDTIYRVELTYRPDVYTPADLDSIAARAARGAAGGMMTIARADGGSINPEPANVQVVANRLRREMNFPQFKVPLEGAWLAQDESVWLQLRQAPEDEFAAWIVVGPSGEVRGRVELPAQARPLWSVGDDLLVSLRDEFDVPWLVGYALRGGGGGVISQGEPGSDAPRGNNGPVYRK